jgi:hypothetical protein
MANRLLTNHLVLVRLAMSGAVVGTLGQRGRAEARLDRSY